MSDSPKRWPFTPGAPVCRNCWTKAPIVASTGRPVVEPGPQDRCAECKAHLRHCRNCMFRTPTGCLLRMPHRRPATGLPGQDCPSFLWRDDDLAEGLEEKNVSGLEG